MKEFEFFYGLLGILILSGVYFIFKALKNKLTLLPTGTPVLDRFSRDLTKEAKDNKIDPIVGREQEIKRLIQILSRRKKNNAIFIGEAGTGKTALAEGIALAIVNKKVPSILQNKRVLAMNLGGMLAGTKYRGEFEERMKAITDELASAGRKIILFIDEIQNLTQAGEATGAIGAADLLKPALARGDIQAIGACLTEDYFRYISRDTSLERRFQPVMLREATAEETLEILRVLKLKYEDFHQVKIADEILKAIVDLATRRLPGRYFPDKAIDLLDEAAAKTRIESSDSGIPEGSSKPEITIKEIESVVSEWESNMAELGKKRKTLDIITEKC